MNVRNADTNGRSTVKMAEERRKRNPAIEKKISQITKDDVRVAVIGTIVEMDNSINVIMIDDGESTIRILLPEEEFEKCEPGKLIRAIGLIAPAMDTDEMELKGEIVQDFSKLDKNLYIEYLKKQNL